MSDRGGMGDGHIKWSAARMWAETHGFTTDQFYNLWYMLREMDNIFLAHQRK